MLKEESSLAAPGVAELETQAREAYQQRRTRECVALTKALLNADPENVHGQMLHSAVQRDMQRDLADAAALLEESLSQGDTSKYKKAAEIILLKVLYLDPDNEQAKTLLTRAKGTSAASAASAACVTPPSQPAASLADILAGRGEEIPFTVGPSRDKKIETKSRRMTIPIALVAVVVLAAALFVIKQSQSTVRGADSFVAAEAPRSSSQSGSPYTTYTTAGSSAGASAATLPATGAVPTVTDTKPTADPTAGAAAKSPNSFDSDGPIAFVEAGTLAVSSPTTAEIYLGDKHLGSTPISLQLLAGRHTLEYRHGDLRTVATHTIRANQTTTAMVNFDVTVQINARPWAQVFVGGTTRRPLGQTPLSNVKVPLGSVLTFENPNFPSKDYRISDTDTAIQVVFP